MHRRLSNLQLKTPDQGYPNRCIAELRYKKNSDLAFSSIIARPPHWLTQKVRRIYRECCIGSFIAATFKFSFKSSILGLSTPTHINIRFKVSIHALCA
jgi:hypothetical protein